MSNFFNYFTEDIGQVFQAFVDAISAFFNFLNYLFNFPMRMDIIRSHSGGFSTTDWVMLLIANVMLVSLCCLIVFYAGKVIRNVFHGGISRKEYEKMAVQVRTLQRDLLRSNYEKDKILAMSMGNPELPEEETSEETAQELPPPTAIPSPLPVWIRRKAASSV